MKFQSKMRLNIFLEELSAYVPELQPGPTGWPVLKLMELCKDAEVTPCQASGRNSACVRSDNRSDDSRQSNPEAKSESKSGRM